MLERLEEGVDAVPHLGLGVVARILEVGAGDGRLTRRYAERISAAVCIDLDLNLLRAAAAESPQDWTGRVTYLQARAEQLPFVAESCEVVLLSWSL